MQSPLSRSQIPLLQSAALVQTQRWSGQSSAGLFVEHAASSPRNRQSGSMPETCGNVAARRKLMPTVLCRLQSCVRHVATRAFGVR